ncbi:dicarboxylic amino acid permease [Boletus edulis BED1]|uniref:Dicarboxylic amino acid permease n=1 Tax=Boletus edulis BED1 TaxID=1328754 RepID=A0AAD4C3Y6_BOLED|nr:dicarboxylic amino acid permease [Boletus edulis BED1]
MTDSARAYQQENMLNTPLRSASDQDMKHRNTLRRELESRHISMIALGGTIGTGLIISSGTALVRGGPLGLCLGYAFVGLLCYLVMVALGEMSAYLPHKRGFAGYATRFVDPAFGFAVGWNYLMKYLIAPASNINAACIVMQYWTRSVPLETWTAIYITCILLINLLGVRTFGELEFWMSGLKILSLAGFILLGIVIDLGGNPLHDRIGFRYWRPPNGPMGDYLLQYVHDGHLATFLGFWSTLTTALFAYIGTELVGVTVGEAKNPKKNVPRAIKRTFVRIFVFYIGTVFVMGLIVPSTSKALFVANSSQTGAAASPIVVGITLVDIRSLNDVVNVIILIFTLSAANSDLYIASRTLHGLALEGKAHRVFAKTNWIGVPWTCLLSVTVFCSLAFLNIKTSSAVVFGYFVNLLSAYGALTWMAITYTHIRFMNALKAQGISRDTLPYKAPMQPFGSWFALVCIGIITIFKGFDAFIPFDARLFVTAYIPIPVFLLLWVGYKVYFRTSLLPPEKVDLVSGNSDEEERGRPETVQMKLRGSGL